MKKFNFHSLSKYSVFIVLLALMIIFWGVSPYFMTLRNLSNIVTQNTYFIIVAIGLSFVMIGGGIDLSVGYQMSLVGVVTAMMMVAWYLPVWLSITLGLLLGIVLGTINGIIVTRIKIFPLIVTLATSVIFQGISYMISQAKTFRNFPEEFLYFTKGKVFGMPFDVFLTIMVIILASFIFYQTIFGLRVIALGGNEEASRLSGINTHVLRISLYAICGFLTALATLVMISKANTTHSSFGPGTEFTAMTAAIVGGISFMGGEGNMPALVAGVMVLAVLGNGMQLAGWGAYPQYVVRGLILLGAVAFDEYQKSARRFRIKSK